MNLIALNKHSMSSDSKDYKQSILYFYNVYLYTVKPVDGKSKYT